MIIETLQIILESGISLEKYMLTEYFEAAMKKARYEILTDDKSFYGSIPGFQGVWANGPTLEGCRAELRETLEDWG